MLRTIGLGSLLCLGAVWAIYPLGVAAAAAVRREKVSAVPRRDRHNPSVSVVLATRDAADVVRRRVTNLLETQHEGEVEVVIALDRAGAPTVAEELADLGPRVRVVLGDEPGGKAANLNAGVRAARGEVLVFTDSHQRFAPDAIPRLVERLGDPRFGAVSGSLDLNGSAPLLIDLYWRLERWLRRNEARLHSTVGATGAIYAMRRSLWKPLPVGLILDDVFVPMRVVLEGYRVGFAEHARAWETRRPTVEQEYRRKVRTLTGNFQLCAWLPNLLLPGRNPVWVQFVFHKPLRLVTPYWVLGVALWISRDGVRWVTANAPVAFAGAAVGALLLLIWKPRIVRILRHAVHQGAVMQAAVVSATLNGVRGRWDVWS